MHELIAPTLNFTILVVILVYFLRKPVKDMVANRHTAIKTQVEEARALKADAEKRYREFTEKLASFEAEAKQLLDRAKSDGAALKTRVVQDAKSGAERMIREAEQATQANIQDFKDQIRRETIARAVELAEKLIRERLSSEDQRRIVTEYVGKVASP